MLCCQKERQRKCQIHFGPVPEGMPVIFELKEDSEFPDELELGEEFTKIAPGTSSHVTILVRNNTDRNILLKRRTELGRVHMVKSASSIPNPADQKYTREEEEPYSEATSHQGHEQDDPRVQLRVLPIDLAPVVQRLDNAIRRINRFPADKC